jgi:Holliday junction DNA helicase RuvA
MTPDGIALAICTEDKKAISKAPGIGPKTAARVILELKDKVHGTSANVSSSDIQSFVPTPSSGKYGEAIDALTVLGFHRATAEEALKTIDVANMELEDIIRDALKKLMK